MRPACIVIAMLGALTSSASIASGLPSPTLDHVVIVGSGSTGDVSGMSVKATTAPTAQPLSSWLRYTSGPNIPVFLGTSSAAEGMLATAFYSVKSRVSGRFGGYFHASAMTSLQQAGTGSQVSAIFPASTSGGGIAEISMPVASSSGGGVYGAYLPTTALGYFGVNGAYQQQYANQGFFPKTCNINNLDVSNTNQTITDWQNYAALLATNGLTHCGAFGDPNSPSQVAYYDFTNSYWNFYKQVALTLGGVALDTPPSYALSQGQGYLNHVVQVIQWANANGIRSSVVLAVYNDNTSYFANVKHFYEYLKTQNALPTEWVVGGYLDGNNNQSTVATMGDEAAAGTLNEVALWMAQNAQVSPSPGFSVTAPSSGGLAAPMVIGGRPDTGQVNSSDVKGLGARGVQDDSECFRSIGGMIVVGNASTGAVSANTLTGCGSLPGFPVALMATGTDTDIPIVLQPKGAGYISTTVPDGTNFGGNTPGPGAVQLVSPGGRLAPQQVASAPYSTLIGGQQSAVYGSYATIVGGVSNGAGGQFSTGVGGNQNSVTGFGSAFVGGQFSTDRGRYNMICFASGDWTGAIGSAGSAQECKSVLTAAPTTATASRLTADGAAAGAANCFNIPDVTDAKLKISLEARDVSTSASHYAAEWSAAHILTRATGASSTLFDGGTGAVTPDSTKTLGSATGETASASADTTNGCINLSFTPPSGNTDTWHVVARVEDVENQ